MGNRQTLKVLFLTICGGALAAAGTICPAGNGTNPFPHSPDNTATGCNVVITIAVGGGISTVVTDSTPYENSEDALIGVKNNSTSPVSSLNLTGSGIFGFEGDGICTFTFVGSNYCTTTQIGGTDPGDYQGPTSTFSNFSTFNSGTVNFSPAIPANGGQTYFSLEGIPTANLGATTGPTPTPGPPTATPAPSTLILTLTALAGMGLFFASRFMKARQ